MLKKFVSSVLAVVLLAGCGKSSEAAPSSTMTASGMCAEIVENLGMENMQEIKQRNVIGLFLAGEREISSDCSAYMSTTSGSSDTVGVFVTEDTDQVIEYVNEYLEEQKAQTQTYFPEEVFKISNAVVESNDTTVILVVADDIEKAKQEALALLGQ